MQLRSPSPSAALGMISLKHASGIQFCIASAGWLDCPSSIMIELEAYAVGLRETPSIFPKPELEPPFVGAMPAELRPRSEAWLFGG